MEKNYFLYQSTRENTIHKELVYCFNIYAFKSESSANLKKSYEGLMTFSYKIGSKL